MKRTSLSQFKKTNQVIRSSKDFHAPSQTKTIKHPFPIYPKLQTRYIFIFLESILNQVDRVFFCNPWVIGFVFDTLHLRIITSL